MDAVPFTSKLIPQLAANVGLSNAEQLLGAASHDFASLSVPGISWSVLTGIVGCNSYLFPEGFALTVAMADSRLVVVRSTTGFVRLIRLVRLEYFRAASSTYAVCATGNCENPSLFFIQK